MRSALLLFGGLVLLGAGIAVLALGMPGAWVVGPALIVAGVLTKLAGFLLTGDAPGATPPGSGRTVTTLGTAAADRAGAAGRSSAGRSSTGRASAVRRARTARTARASETARAVAQSRPFPEHRRGGSRRAS
ncbi:hypothetical protein [Actinomycetospora aeridis]|uniref:Integral membrane protein n=1 Tax=Actinomycetospora aeridis TaxID=3129231 RepID=A0ABU8N9U5_9PSEU